MITGYAHVNLTVPEGTLKQADTFYGETLGLTPREVPQLQRGMLAWFDIASSGQQLHVAFGPNELKSSRHPCFRIESPEALLKLRQRIWDHHVRADDAAPQEADKPGQEASGEYHQCNEPSSSRSIVRLTICAGSKGPEYPQRFFARDYAGNRLEFSL